MKLGCILSAGIAVSLAFTSTSRAVPVDVEVTGKVALNTFTSFPFSGTTLGSDVRLRFRVESTSGIVIRPGFRVGLNVSSATLDFSQSANGPISLPIRSVPYTMAVFGTSAIVSALPDQDEIDFGGSSFMFGAVRFEHTLHIADGDNASWPSDDFSVLSACGFPGENFLGPNPNDFKHWYLTGDLLDPGVMNFRLDNVRRVAASGSDGDMNVSGVANGADLQRFINAILAHSVNRLDLCHGDFSGNQIIDVADIPGMVQTLLTGMPPPPPPPFGACCYLDENVQRRCVEVATAAACMALPGFEQTFTPLTHCADMDPKCGGGACCLSNGNCIRVGLPDPFTECTNAGGNYVGDGSVCSPNTCFGAAGACCVYNPQNGIPTGQCLFIGRAACDAAPGNFQGEGTTCDLNPCAGVCCLDGQSCQILTNVACSTSGGHYLGDGTTCDFSPCPPANDNCQNAQVVSDGTTYFTLAGATTDGDEPPSTAGCPLGFDPDNYLAHDVWFVYLASCTGLLQIDTCGSYFLGESSDTSIAVYDDCNTCPPHSDTAAMLACNESHSTGAQVQHCISALEDASVRILVTQGHCYKIRMGTTTGRLYGRSVMHITCGGACCPADHNSLCYLATQADCQAAGGTYQGNGSDCLNNTCPH